MKCIKILLTAALCATWAGTSWADGRHHHHHHHGHGARLGVYVGVPFGFGWYSPTPYYYPQYYYAPPVVVRQAPQVYIERAAPQPAPQAEAYWHYCSNPAGYYPYVQQCPGGWQRVVPTPPPN